MPTYEITGPDGKVYEVTGETPEGAVAAVKKLSAKPKAVTSFGSRDEQLDRWAAQNPIASRASVFLQGVPFVGEYMDEMLGKASGNPTGTEQMRAMQSREARERPIQTAATQMLGGITAAAPLLPLAAGMMPAGASMAAKVGTGLAVGAPLGAVEGAVSGYGSGTDDQSRMKNAKSRGMIGGALGGALGAGAPVAQAGIKSGVNRLLDWATVGKQAKGVGLSRPSYEMLTRTMQADDSLGPQGLQRLVRAGPDAMVADAGPTSRALLDASIQASGPAARVASNAIDERAATAARNVNAAMDQNVAPLRPTGQSTFERQTDLRPLYDRAYSQPIDYSNPTAMEVENIIRTRIPPAAIREANDMMRRQGEQSQQILARVADDGSIEFERLPDTRQLDYIARALGEVADTADGQGKLGGTTAKGRDYRNLQQDIRRRLRSLNPDYDTALNAAGTEIGRRNSFEFGREVLRPGTSRQQVFEHLDGLADVERAEVAQGIRQQFDDALANVRAVISDHNTEPREAMQALRELTSRASREKVGLVVGDVQADRLFRQLDRAAAALELRAGVAQNSKTFARQNLNRMVRGGVEEGLPNKVREGNLTGSSSALIASALGRSPADKQRLIDNQYEEIARLLTERRGPDAMLALNTLSRIGRRLPINEEIARALANQGTGAIALPAYQTGTRPQGR
jgi:hypothetical protein